MATVIGPTPPGTGVIHLALFRASSKSTSPTNLEPDAFDGSLRQQVFFRQFFKMKMECYYYLKLSLPGIELIPQSITTAPSLIHSPFTIFGWPIPTTSMSAFATYYVK